jgi:multidrug efflux pump subunit AcrA (membrane-fusion protein)
MLVWTGIVAGLALIGGAVWYFLGGLQPTASAAQNTVDYYTAQVTRGNLRVSITGTGTLAARQSYDLSFSTAGTVTELNVKVGDAVTAGQILASIGSQAGLDAAAAAARLEVLQARKTLSDLQANAGLALAQSYQDLVTAQEAAKTAQAKLDRTAYARCGQDKNSQLAQRLDAAKTKLDFLSISNTGTDAWVTARSEYETAAANLAYCSGYTPDEVTTYQAELAVAEQTLANAEKAYADLKEASGVDPAALTLAEAALTKAETALAKAEEDLTGINLVAPVDGKVVYLAGAAGSIAGTAKFITVADISRPLINVTVDSTNLSELVVGRAVDVAFDAIPDIVFKGALVQVDPQLSSFGQYSGATAKAELDVDAAKALANVPLGLSGSVEVISQSAENVLLIPVEALRDLGGGSYAVFVVENGQLRLQTVEIGIQDSTQVEIVSGLNEGAIVSTGLIQAGS